jgi:hypothetical protein
MDEKTSIFLNKVGIMLDFSNNTISEILISRDSLLSDSLYESVKESIGEFKKIYSSSSLTSLHKKAGEEQRWPLLNLVRQILAVHGYKMKPIRKSDGYTLEGIKKYKRFFLISKT